MTDVGLDGEFGTADDGEEVCGGTEIFMPKRKFADVSATLLFLDLVVEAESTLAECLEADGEQTVSLFDECLGGYLWDYTNNGLKLLQLRFYPIIPA
jgi:hypothetical protein